MKTLKPLMIRSCLFMAASLTIPSTGFTQQSPVINSVIGAEAFAAKALEDQNWGAIAGMYVFARSGKGTESREDSAKIAENARRISDQINSAIAGSRDPSKIGDPLWFKSVVVPALDQLTTVGAAMATLETGLAGGVAVKVVGTSAKNYLSDKLHEALRTKSVPLAVSYMQSLLRSADADLQRVSQLREQNLALGHEIDRFSTLTLGFSLGTSPDEICKIAAHFCQDAKIETLLAMSRGQRLSEQEFSKMFAEFVAESRENQERVSEQKFTSLQQDLHYQGVSAGIQLLGAVVSNKNPELARRTVELGSAIVETHKAFKAMADFMDAAKEQNKGISMSDGVSMFSVLSGNYLNVAMKLISFLCHSNPPPSIEEVILKELRAFRDEFRDFTLENREAISNLDIRIVDVFGQLNQRMDELARGQQKMQSSLETLNTSIGEIYQVDRAMDRDLSNKMETVARRVFLENRRKCLRGKSATISNRLNLKQFQKCLGQFDLYISEFSVDDLAKTSLVGTEGKLILSRYADLLNHAADSHLGELLLGTKLFLAPSTSSIWGSEKRFESIPNLYDWKMAAEAEIQLIKENLHYVDAGQDLLSKIRGPVAEFESLQKQLQSPTKRSILLQALSVKMQESVEALDVALKEEKEKSKTELGLDVLSDDLDTKSPADILPNAKMEFCPGTKVTDHAASWNPKSKSATTRVNFTDRSALLMPSQLFSLLPRQAAEIAALGLRKANFCVLKLERVKSPTKPMVKYYAMKKNGSRGAEIKDPFADYKTPPPPMPMPGPSAGIGASINKNSGVWYECDYQTQCKRMFLTRDYYDRLNITVRFELSGEPVSTFEFKGTQDFPAYQDFEKTKAKVGRTNSMSRKGKLIVTERKYLENMSKQTNRTMDMKTLLNNDWGTAGSKDSKPIVKNFPFTMPDQAEFRKSELRSKFYQRLTDELEIGNGVIAEPVRDLDMSIRATQRILEVVYPNSLMNNFELRSGVYGRNGIVEEYFGRLRKSIVRGSKDSTPDPIADLRGLSSRMGNALTALATAPEMNFERAPSIQAVEDELEALSIKLSSKNPYTIDQAERLLMLDLVAL